jgi:peptide/nickel transport system substrate-binding protein
MAALSRWSVVLLACAVLLGGCGGGSHSSHSTAPGFTSGPTRCCMDPAAIGPVTMAGATRGGTVTVLTHDGLKGTLDPSEVYDRDVLSIDRGLLTRSLTQYGYDRYTKQMVLVPDLATDLGWHNDAYTKWRYTIRPGVRFENGERVTAQSVARGVRRCMHAARFPTGPCQHYAHVYVRSVHVVRHHTVEFSMRKPFPDMPYFGAFPEMGPIPAHGPTDATTYRQHPLATGPFKIADYRRGKRLVLVRNDLWDPRTDPARTQYPDRYVFRAGVPTGTVDRTLLRDTGADQTTLSYDNVSRRAFALWQAAPDRLVLGGQPCTTYVVPDNRTVRDPLVRRALSWAYPYRAVLVAEDEIPDVTALPATNLIPPGIQARKPYRVTSRRGFDHDAGRARSLLRRAHALGFPIRLPFDRDDREAVRVKNTLVPALRAAGFTPEPLATFGDLAGRPDPQTDLRTTTSCGDWPSGTSWIGPMASPERNAAHFSAPPGLRHEITRVPTLPLAMQPDAWNSIDHKIMRGYFPMVPAFYGGVAMTHGSRVRGMKDDETLGMPTWQRLWVRTR